MAKGCQECKRGDSCTNKHAGRCQWAVTLPAIVTPKTGAETLWSGGAVPLRCSATMLGLKTTGIFFNTHSQRKAQRFGPSCYTAAPYYRLESARRCRLVRCRSDLPSKCLDAPTCFDWDLIQALLYGHAFMTANSRPVLHYMCTLPDASGPHGLAPSLMVVLARGPLTTPAALLNWNACLLNAAFPAVASAAQTAPLRNKSGSGVLCCTCKCCTNMTACDAPANFSCMVSVLPLRHCLAFPWGWPCNGCCCAGPTACLICCLQISCAV